MNARLHYAVEGPAGAPVVVLGSSIGTTAAMWQPQIPLLTRHFRVLRFDHRGHGQSWPGNGPRLPSASDPASRPWSIADLGGDVVGLLDDLGFAKVSYVGISLGGMVGMWLAAHRPERIDKLVVVCTSAHLDAREYWLARAATVRSGGMVAIADPVVEKWFTPEFALRRPAVVTAFKQMLAATPVEGYARSCEALATMDLRPDLASIGAPTVVVAGADDLAIPAVHGQRVAAAVPGARFVVVHDAAHLASVEQPEQIAEIIAEHVGDEER